MVDTSLKKLESMYCDIPKITMVEIQFIMFAMYNINVSGSNLINIDYVSCLKV